ncbi:MAG: serine/threonine protein kinase [Planctomycetes bacterium]|nr:serine/threonine protein kinase [Planctomycetota bacterium]
MTQLEIIALEPHLAACSICVAKLEQLGGTDSAVQVIREAQTPSPCSSLGATPQDLIRKLQKADMHGDKSDISTPEDIGQKQPERLVEGPYRIEVRDISAPSTVPIDVQMRMRSSVPVPAQKPRPADLPEQVGRYVVEEELARGGMGRIVRVRDNDFERPLAMKVLLRNSETEMAKRFVREALVTGRLQHPGIPPVHEFGQLPDGKPYFIMKLIQGRSLRNLLKERTNPIFELPHLVSIFEQVCQTIGYAHARNVIHRDLKSSNVMVGAFGEVQVMDWGLAKVIGTQVEEEDAPEAMTPRSTACGARRRGPRRPRRAARWERLPIWRRSKRAARQLTRGPTFSAWAPSYAKY